MTALAALVFCSSTVPADELPYADGIYASDHQYCATGPAGTENTRSFFVRELKGQQLSLPPSRQCEIANVSKDGVHIFFSANCKVGSRTQERRVYFKQKSETSFETDGQTFNLCPSGSSDVRTVSSEQQNSNGVLLPNGDFQASPIAATDNRTVVGTWEGYYVCQQGRTGLRLTILEENSQLRGRFELFKDIRTLKQSWGIIDYGMDFNSKTGALNASNGRWIKKPAPNWQAAPFDGEISANGAEFSGTIRLQGCAEIRVSKVSTPIQEVSAEKLQTKHQSITTEDEIIVDVSGLKPNKEYWLTVIPKAEPIGKKWDWQYTIGSVEKTFVFRPKLAGEYEIRLHRDTDDAPLLGKLALSVQARTTPTDAQLARRPIRSQPVRSVGYLNSMRMDILVGFEGETAELSIKTTQNQCDPSITLRMDIVAARLFANNHEMLNNVWPEVRSRYMEICPDAAEFRIFGRTPSFGGNAFIGSAKKSNDWHIEASRSPVWILKEQAKSVADDSVGAAKLVEFVNSPFVLSVTGRDSIDHRDLRSFVDTQIVEIGRRFLVQTKTRISSLTDKVAINAVKRQVMRQVQNDFPGASQDAEQIFLDRNAQIKVEAEQLISASLKLEENTASAYFSAIKRGEDLRKKFQTDYQDHANDLATALNDLEEQGDAFLQRHKSSLRAVSPSWASVNSLQKEVEFYTGLSAKTPQASKFRVASTQRLSEIYRDLAVTTKDDILRLNTNFAKLAETIDKGQSLIDRFAKSEHGKNQVKLLKTALYNHVNTIVERNYPLFLQSLENVPSTIKTVDELIVQKTDYDQLKDAFPGFQRYSEAISTNIDQMRDDLCELAHTAMDEIGSHVVVAGQSLPLNDLACIAIMNGNELSVVAEGDRDITLVAKAYDGITIQYTAARNANGTYVVSSVKNEAKQDNEPSEAHIQELWAFLRTGKATGVPNADGLTRCDLLAADPADKPRAKVRGVAKSNVSVPRALEACVAAVEFDPQNTVQNFQLGRVLYVAKDYQGAEHFLRKAADKGHGAAHANLAELYRTTKAGDDLVLTHARLAVADGYSSAISYLRRAQPDYPIDFANVPPSSGSFGLSCFAKVDIDVLQEGAVIDYYEFQVFIDLNKNLAVFDYPRMVRGGLDGVPLLPKRETVPITHTGSGWSFPINTINKSNRSVPGPLAINRRSLKVFHQQQTQVDASFGIIPLFGKLFMEGECFQDLDNYQSLQFIIGR